MFSEQCKRKAERAQKLQRAWNWQLVVPPVLLTAVWTVCSLNHLPSARALSLYVTLSLHLPALCL